jgi:hypothetical protein
MMKAGKGEVQNYTGIPRVPIWRNEAMDGRPVAVVRRARLNYSRMMP